MESDLFDSDLCHFTLQTKVAWIWFFGGSSDQVRLLQR